MLGGIKLFKIPYNKRSHILVYTLILFSLLINISLNSFSYGEEDNGPEGGPYITHLRSNIRTNDEIIYTFTDNKYYYVVPLEFEIMKELRTHYHMAPHIYLNSQRDYGGTSTELLRHIVYLDNSGTEAHTIDYVLDYDTEARLAKIEINDEDLSDFHENTYEYDYDAYYKEPIHINPISVDRFASIEVSGNDGISNKISIEVTSKDNSVTKNYNINLNYLENKYLDKMSINNNTVAQFVYESPTYEATLPYDFFENLQRELNTPEITEKQAYENSGFNLNYDSTYDLNINYPTSFPNDMTIEVNDSEGNHLKNYTIHLNIEKSSNAYLSEINIDGLSLDNFNYNDFSYDVVLPLGTTNVPIISALSEDEDAHISINNPTSLPGKATITVTAPDNSTTNVYAINYNIKLNDNPFLENIYINNLLLNDFQYDNFTYHVKLDYNSINVPNIRAMAQDINARVEIIRPDFLPATVLIHVTAQNEKDFNTYEINFTRKSKPKTKKNSTPRPSKVQEPLTPLQELKEISAKTSSIVENIQSSKDAEVVVENFNNSIENINYAIDSNTPLENSQEIIEEISHILDDIHHAIDKIEDSQTLIDTSLNTIKNIGQLLEKVSDDSSNTLHIKESLSHIGERAIERASEIVIKKQSSSNDHVIFIDPHIIDNHISKSHSTITHIKNEVKKAVGEELAKELKATLTVDMTDSSYFDETTATFSKKILSNIKDKDFHSLTLKMSKASFKLQPDTFKNLHEKDELSLEVSNLKSTPSSTSIDNQRLKGAPLLDFTMKNKDSEIKDFNKVVEVSFDLSEVDLNKYTSQDLENLTVVVFDENTHKWIPVGGKYDPIKNVIEVYRSHFSKYTVIKSNKSFSDVHDNNSAKEINVLLNKGILEENQEFNPDTKTTRAEFIGWVGKTLGIEEKEDSFAFTDVNESTLNYKQIAAAYDAGLIKGRDDKTFDPKGYISTEEALTIIGSALENYEGVTPPKDITDKLASLDKDNKLSPWAKSGVAISNKKDILNNHIKELFNPADNMKKSEAATLVYNLYNKI